MSPDLICIVIALVCFVAAALGVSSPKVNLVAAGLAAWVATLLF